VRGNLDDGGYLKTKNTTAEWNLFVDPLAAQRVFQSGAKIRLMPLDATNKVPIHKDFLSKFEAGAKTPLAKFVAQVLETDRKYIEDGIFFAWDPLAAVALVHPEVVKSQALHVEVRLKAPEEGRTTETKGSPNAAVALDADGAKFEAIFSQAFRK
jgi:inosine-uridine nucleoside N-ribohydrolase